MKTKENKGISLIVLVITIIVIIILATAVIVTILDNNPISSALRAVEESNISKYKEQIELIRGKLQLQNEDYSSPTIYQMQETLDKEKWVSSTEMIMDEGIEKLKLTTKEGYVFYITGEEVEYKGKGGVVVDTSALKRDDVLELVAEEETAKGKNVKITSIAEEYYSIKYKIGEEGSWKEIKSGEKVEVPYGETIYAKLVYGSSSGIEFKLKIGEINPTVVAKSIDTSNMTRKTNKVFSDLFDITWGSEGTGEVKYEVEGNLLFKGKKYSNASIENIKELELGTYNVKCIITTSSGSYTTNAQKQVKVKQLASTSVINASSSNVDANAIYSEYDLAYFRDLVNGGKFTINGRLMNDINLSNVCSESVGDWIPIGNYNPSSSLSGMNEATIYYNGIFDGNDYKIENMYINNNNLYRQGLFSILKSEAIVKNINIYGNIVTGTTSGRNCRVFLWNN